MAEQTDINRFLLATLAAVAVFISTSNTVNAEGFVHGFVVNVDGEGYYLLGPPDGPNGERDLPGHEWVQAGPEGLMGKHNNTGPFGATQWWSSDAPDGELLYVVKGAIDTWTEEKAVDYASQGYMHYHELVRVSDGVLHPTKVVWLRHIARTTFTLDGGPPVPVNQPHEVSPGIDYEFIPNGLVPYDPGA